MPSSSGWRNCSSTLRGNSGSSSKKRTRQAYFAPPRGVPDLPPINAASETNDAASGTAGLPAGQRPPALRGTIMAVGFQRFSSPASCCPTPAAHKKHVMFPSGGNFDRARLRHLAAHIAKVECPGPVRFQQQRTPGVRRETFGFREERAQRPPPLRCVSYPIPCARRRRSRGAPRNGRIALCRDSSPTERWSSPDPPHS
jgi:hypothetical protein